MVDESFIHKMRSHKLGVLSTYGEEYPYASLVSVMVAADGRSLVFPTDRRTRKYLNLRQAAHVSVLLDNRGEAEKSGETAYALTVLGSARELTEDLRPAVQADFLICHPNLAEFLNQPQTALIKVVISKIVAVERFQDVREFVWPSE